MDSEQDRVGEVLLAAGTLLVPPVLSRYAGVKKEPLYLGAGSVLSVTSQ